MTDNEIIKAYACCNLSDFGGCDECPCKQEGECIIPTKGFDLEREVYSVLNRQKAELERLERHTEMYHEVRSEAFKEFAKLLIDKAENGVISIANLPEYVKEMVSDAK